MTKLIYDRNIKAYRLFDESNNHGYVLGYKNDRLVLVDEYLL